MTSSSPAHFVDSHCHIDDACFDADRSAVLARAQDAGVLTMLVMGVMDEQDGHRRALEIARTLNMPAAVGIHPHEARHATPARMEEIRDLARRRSIVAIGEIGLDYHYDHSPREIQQGMFAQQLRLAREVGLPVILHTREADEDTLAILERERPLENGGVFHCFSGDERLAERALALGYALSFSGIVAFPRASTIHRVAQTVPEDRLLIETDAPYLAPPPHRGQRNEPAYVVQVAQAIAALRGVSVEHVARFCARVLLIVLLALGLLRLFGFAWRFSQDSLQLDFSAYYTAGEADQRGLSPYRNHADQGLWDGLCRFQHSRFLYPPLTATLFRPLAWLSFFDAKRLFTALSFCAVVLSAVWLIRRARLPLEAALGLAALLTWFHPLLPLLERGQVEGFTLLGVTLALDGIEQEKARRTIWAGILLALTTLFKLHLLLLMPFLLLLKRTRALLAWIAALAALALISLAINGPAALADYMRVQMPRIARHAEFGTREMLLPEAVLAPLKAGVPSQMSFKDGRTYKQSDLNFITNATLVRPIENALEPRGLRPGASAISIGAFALVFALILIARRGARAAGDCEEGAGGIRRESALALVVILLVSPFTWAMSTVWTWPAVVAIASGVRSLQTRARATALALAA
ncbi:MAG: YchF/TatD family DNA exonuclease, partial [Vicinamibacteria bacterium]|nr:YchF/TatD family DNA exonuclease [Vicinamibacteria bacterium]